jgi:hypothetical protein
MGEEAPEPRSLLGLVRLSPDGIVLLSMFIHRWSHRGAFGRRPRRRVAQHAHRDLATARTKLEELATSEYREYREVACDLVPYFALADPDVGYRIWRDLLRDSEGRVAEEAATTLAKHLGVLALDMDRVVELIDAHFEPRTTDT